MYKVFINEKKISLSRYPENADSRYFLRENTAGRWDCIFEKILVFKQLIFMERILILFGKDLKIFSKL